MSSGGLVGVAQFRLAQAVCAVVEAHAAIAAAHAALIEALAEGSSLALLTGPDGARLREALELQRGAPLESADSALLRRLAARFAIDDPVCVPLTAAAVADGRWRAARALADVLRGLPPF